MSIYCIEINADVKGTGDDEYMSSFDFEGTDYLQ